jgi:hypothetical protein
VRFNTRAAGRPHAAVVDAYRARWVVEEFFKALKTGCQIEKRQMETYEALRIALALFLPIAVRLLALRLIGVRDEGRNLGGQLEGCDRTMQ